MIRTALVFDHRGRAGRNENGSIEIRITVNRKASYIATGIRVPSSKWKAGRIVGMYNEDVLNDRLDIMVRKVENEVNRLMDTGEEPDIAEIRRMIWDTREREAGVPGFINWYEDQLELLNLKKHTLNRYRCTLNRLREFGKIRRWEDVTTANIYAFDAWLHERTASTPGRSGRRISDAGVFNYHKNLRHLLYRAVKLDLLGKNPYERLRGEFKQGNRENTEYLTEEEMRAIEEMRPTPGSQLEKARDIFVFQMYTGLSYSDAQAFDISNYRQTEGRWVYRGDRVKTGVSFVGQLLPPAVDVLERNGWRVPRMLNVKYNNALKTLGTACGISVRMHSHLARHTFATFMLRNGVKIENLARMMGHTNIGHTQRYAKVLADSVHREFDMVQQRLKSARER